MISQKMQDYKKILRKNYAAEIDWTQIDYQILREEFNKNVVLEPLPEGVAWKEEIIGGVMTERIFVPDAGEKIIMHIHGGGMVQGDASSARFMLSHIGSLTKRNTVSVDYRLCPEYAYPAALEDCAAVYQGLLEEGNLPENIALMGESAGGMLVLMLCAYLKKNGIVMPGCVCAISGSVDAQYESNSMVRNRETEIVVNANLKDMMHAIYYKDANPEDSVVSPIYSDVSGWPPVYFHACKEEILLDESVRMYQKLEAAGVETELTVVEDLFHTYMMFDLPESYDAFEQIARFINRY